LSKAHDYRRGTSAPVPARKDSYGARVQERSRAAASALQVRKTSAFDSWIPRDYLAEYFSELQQDERLVLRYFVEQMREVEVGPVLLFGCGPGLNHAFLTAPYFSELVLSDYLARNLAEIEAWHTRTRLRMTGIHLFGTHWFVNRVERRPRRRSRHA
jgi:NNMT/PNMT/TEMT family